MHRDLYIRNIVFIHRWAAVLAFAIAVCAPGCVRKTHPPPGAAYAVTDVGTLGGGFSSAVPINSKGQVAGGAQTANREYHAFLFSNHTIKKIDQAGRFGCQTTAINNNGQVVGAISDIINGHVITYVAYEFSDGKLRKLGRLGGTESSANGINDKGQVVGDAYTAAGDQHAVMYWNGQVRDLGTLGGGDSQANSINNAGDIVGESQTVSGKKHAFLYIHGRMQDLGVLGGSASGASYINSTGMVVGSAQFANHHDHACMYANGKNADLGTLGGMDSYALCVNNHGAVVGSSRTNDKTEHAFLYENGKMHDLNDDIDKNSGWQLIIAAAINDKGEIVGQGIINGNAQGFVLSPMANVSHSIKKSLAKPTRPKQTRAHTN